MEIKKYNNFFKDKKVLVTGHTGFKGSWLCLLLHELGANVYGYALNPPTQPSLYEIANINDLVNSTIGDIRDYQLLKKTISIIQPDIIIHLAAQSLVRESYKSPRETYEINVMGTVNLFDAIRNVDSVRVLLNITSDKCYENQEWYWGYRENDKLGGYDPYSNSKGCSELVTSAFRNSFFNPKLYEMHKVAVASARAGNVIGGGDWASDRLIPDLIRAIAKDESVTIRNPYAVRPWQFVLEPLSGYLQLVIKLYTEGAKYTGAWNFGPDNLGAKSVEWIVNKIYELWGSGIKYIVENSFQPHETNYLKLDCSKASTLLNWYPTWSIEKTISVIVDWTKAYLNNENIRKVCLNQIHDFYSDYKL